MEDVQRYDHAGGMLEFDTGPFVRYDDYAAILAEVERLTAERDEAIREAEICKAIIKHCGGSFVVKCMLCGKPFDVRDPDWLKHDLMCSKHPMRAVERERDAALARIEKARVILLFRGNGMSDVSIMDRALAALTEVPT